MSEFWDSVTVANNPNEKEIIISFDGSGGYGAFGSKNNSNEEDPGGLGTDPGNTDDPEKPVLPSPEEDSGGTTGGFVSSVVPAQEPLQQCLGHSCTEYVDYYVNGGDGRLAHGVNPTYAGGLAAHTGPTNGEGINIDNPGGFPSNIYDHRFASADITTLDPYDNRCDTSDETWRLYRDGMPWPSRYKNVYDAFPANAIAGTPGDPPPTYPPNDLGAYSRAYDYYDEVWLYLDFNDGGAQAQINAAIEYRAPELYGTDEAGTGSIPSVSTTPGILLWAGAGSPNINITDNTATSDTQIVTADRTISRGLPEINGWWRLQYRSVYSIGPLYESPTIDGLILRDVSSYKRLELSKPGLVHFLSETREDSFTSSRIRGISNIGLEPSRYFFSFDPSLNLSSFGAPKCYAIADKLHAGAYAFSRSQTTYTPPTYCERV